MLSSGFATGRRTPARGGSTVAAPRFRSVVIALVLVLAALPAAAERVVMRSGDVVVGTPRFEGDQVVVVRPDGSEVRMPRAEVERIELSADQQPEAAQPAAPPAYPPYPPPVRRPPPAQEAPAIDRAYDRDGFAMTFGYHRGLAFGGEWQLRPVHRGPVGLGLGAQVGLESGDDVAYTTYGLTARAYFGHQNRVVTEAGVGRNKIIPGPAGCDSLSCAEVNFGPEFSVGFQRVSRSGFIFEVLGTAVVLTNEDIRDELNESVTPAVQLSFGYLFH
jgi:hypothetical protein